ncbi:Arc family DNA-binding protein [Pseudomonas sp. ADAK2]|uniref:Arc family DNA-binding protein n=1 Tax=unclassified Pseudomonas TaxID=196821 RepID=UPI001462D1D6|nr:MULTISPECIES: Arc family DNA-binding protein [unclassified Pseudomonas]QJI45233.1 Arc family DNA-binding protein [Pseudomonas sp. ADAK7]QJI51534.1 Arc family DNA-binding protein [Pseudomonas sp. ADAK2]
MTTVARELAPSPQVLRWEASGVCGKFLAFMQEKPYIKFTLLETKLPNSHGFQGLVVEKALNRFVLRLPEGLRLTLKRIAKENRRSLNAEIVIRMEQSFAALDRGKPGHDEIRLALIREVLGANQTLEKIEATADSD